MSERTAESTPQTAEPGPEAASGPVSPVHYGDPAAEYETARRAAVLIDRSRHGRVRVAGNDRIKLVQRLSTNDMQGLAPGRGVRNIVLTPKGRIVDLFDALVFEDHLLLLLARTGGLELVEWIRRFVFRDQVEAVDSTAETVELAVSGPAAGRVLEAAGAGVSGLEGRDHRAAEIAGTAVTIAGGDPIAGRSYRLIAARGAGPSLRQVLLERGAPLGLLPAGTEVAEILRVEAGVPAAGLELDERVNPLEAELRDAISFTKGCYTGQEIVARLNTYKKVQRALRGLKVGGAAIPEPGSRVLAAGGTEAGRVTSAVRSPGLGSVLALAYIELEHAEPGTRLAVEVGPPGATIPAEVLAPPFVGGA